MYAMFGELKMSQDLFNNLSGKDMVAWSEEALPFISRYAV